jgi:ATP-dependent helicase/nuclease subunit A
LFCFSFAEIFSRNWSVFVDDFVGFAGYLAPYELLTAMCSRYRVFENFPESHGFIMRLLELLKEQERDYPSLSDFLDFFDNAQEDILYVKMSDPGSVKVLTVHKSKGLEFPAVVIPFMQVQVDAAALAAKGKKAHAVYEQKDNLVMMYSKPEYFRFAEHVLALYRTRFKRALIDELNTLYVALTRAKDELYLYVPSKIAQDKEEENPLLRLLPPLPCEFGSPVSGESRHMHTQRPLWQLPAAKYSDCLTALYQEADDVQLSDRLRVRAGEIIHSALAFVPRLVSERYLPVISAAGEKAGIFFDLESAEIQGLQERLQKIVTDKKLRDFFFTGDDTIVFCEKEIVDRTGYGKRIDRLVISGSEAVILDYKSSHAEQPSGRKQVAEYMRLVQAVYPEKRIRGVLVYLDTIALEEVES